MSIEQCWYFVPLQRSGMWRNPGQSSPFLNVLSIVDLRINKTLKTGAVRKSHLPGGESVYLFLAFTINDVFPI